MTEHFDWLKPSPFWQQNGADLRQGQFYRPLLLEYRVDEFMERFLADVAKESAADLRRHIHAPDQDAGEEVVKLYQPAHRAYYLVCASLSCRLPGLPDRMVNTADDESIFFVLRRLSADGEEAWVQEDGVWRWKSVGENRREVAAIEERQPMFDARSCCQRSVRVGYIPVASREPAVGSPAAGAVGIPPGDLRLSEFEVRFLSPLTTSVVKESEDKITLLEAAATAPNTPPDLALRLSIYLMLDLWETFERHLPRIAKQLAGEGPEGLLPAESDLLAFLEGTAALSGTPSLRGLLESVAEHAAMLNRLGDENLPETFDSDFDLTGRLPDVAAWRDALGAALTALHGDNPPPVLLPRVNPGASERFVIRCVYERPQCSPIQQWVSHPTPPFELASLYDIDAPARPVAIALPADVSVAALRKFQKSATFVISDSLRNKISQVTGLDMMDDDQDLGQLSLSYVCSFSIPIITICAFILLLIMVIVLNFVFWWLPFLKICLPIPQPDDS